MSFRLGDQDSANGNGYLVEACRCNGSGSGGWRDGVAFTAQLFLNLWLLLKSFHHCAYGEDGGCLWSGYTLDNKI